MSFKSFNILLSKTETVPEAEAAAGGQRPWIPVIEDDPMVRKSLETLLKDRYQVLLCASAQEGVDAFHSDIYAGILDVKMKGHDGFWACDQIRKKNPHLPIIFFSAYQDIKNPYEIINQHRPFAYILKDGDSKRLLHTIDVAVSLYKVFLGAKMLSEDTMRTRYPGDIP